MCEQSSPQQQLVFPIHPKDRLSVGYLLEDETQILVSEGKNPSGIYYTLWMPMGRGRIWEIDNVTPNKSGTWDYRRKFRCNNLECLTRTFLTLVNPDAKFITKQSWLGQQS